MLGYERAPRQNPQAVDAAMKHVNGHAKTLASFNDSPNRLSKKQRVKNKKSLFVRVVFAFLCFIVYHRSTALDAQCCTDGFL